MPSSKPSRVRFRYYAVLSILLASLWLGWTAQGAGERFSVLGTRHTALITQLYYYQLASIASFNNPNYIEKLADLYLKMDRPDLAVRTLRRSGNNFRIAQVEFASARFTPALESVNKALDTKRTPELLIIKTKILLELDRAGEAEAAAREAGGLDLGNTASQLWLGASLAIQDKQEQAQGLIASMGTTEAAETLRQISISKILLARYLYSQGLLDAPERVLNGQPCLNSECFSLLADIALARRPLDNGQLIKAADILRQGTRNDPGSLELHRRLLGTYQLLGDQEGADRERQLIQALGSGNI